MIGNGNGLRTLIEKVFFLLIPTSGGANKIYCEE